jgi:N-acetylglucosaminyldiphosphoundecaprenol N-acetyl-beta-D-mannosaminyltransferase
MTTLPTENIAGHDVCTLSRDRCIAEMTAWVEKGNHAKYFACANPHAISVAAQQDAFKAALAAADWLTPDGVGVVIASRLLGGRIRERVTGSDVFSGLSRSLSERGGFTAFFLGSTEKTLAAIEKRHAEVFPGLKIAGMLSPPFAPKFSVEQTNSMLEAVNRVRPDVLWVGMTAPKQELWIHENLARLDVRFVGAVGAVFDFFAGTVERPGHLYQQLGVEWLGRLIAEPRRLWQRTIISVPRFLWLVTKHRALGS